jgi:hypothetical protein
VPTVAKPPAAETEALSKAHTEETQPQPKPISSKQRRRELERQCLALGEEHGLSRDYAYLVATEVWTLARAKQRQAVKDDAQARLEREAARAAIESAFLGRWVQEQTTLVRLEPGGSSEAKLQEVMTYDFRWSDSPEPQSKILVLALFTSEDYTRWADAWKVDPKLASELREVPKRCRDRVRIPAFLWIKARERVSRCLVKLLNGVILEGYVRWSSPYAVALASSLEEDCPCCFILLHGVHSVERLSSRQKSLPDVPSERAEEAQTS